MKTLLITLLMLLGVVSSSNQNTANKGLLISRTEIYINQNDMLQIEHWVRPPYFRYDYEVEYKLFEKFVLTYNEEDVIKWIKQIKETQKQDTLIRRI